MNKLVVKIAEENLIELDIKIHNDSVTINESDVTVRMVVDGDNNLNYFFDGKKNGDVYAIRVPRLKGIVGVGERNCFIEVVCYDKYFKAWEGVVELQEAIKVEVSPRNKNNIMENTRIEINPVVRVIEIPKNNKEIIKEDKKKEIEEEVKEVKEEKKDNVVFEIVMDKPVRKTKKNNTINENKKKVVKQLVNKKRNTLSFKSIYSKG